MVYHLLVFSRMYNFRVAIIPSSSNVGFEFLMLLTQKSQPKQSPFSPFTRPTAAQGTLSSTMPAKPTICNHPKEGTYPDKHHMEPLKATQNYQCIKGQGWWMVKTIISNVLKYWWRILAQMHNAINCAFYLARNILNLVWWLVGVAGIKTLRCRRNKMSNEAMTISFTACHLGHEHAAHQSTTTIAMK